MGYFPEEKINKYAPGAECVPAMKIWKLPDGKEFPITCSIGIAFCPDDGTQYDQLLERADQALYYVKNHGNDGWAYYDAALLSPAGMPSIFSNLSDIDPSQEK